MTDHRQSPSEEHWHRQTIERLERENREQAVKLNILYAFIEMLRKGYDALLHHGVNYQNLPEYKRDKPLDHMQGRPLKEAQAEAISWIGRVQSGIAAAIRRKQFQVHDNPPPPDRRH